MDHPVSCLASCAGGSDHSALSTRIDGWYSIKLGRSSIPPDSSIFGSSTLRITFPDLVPDIRPKYMHMQRHKPHSKKPESTVRFAVWGAWNAQSTAWMSLCVATQPNTAFVLRTRLEHLLSQPGTDARITFGTHWAEIVHFIYHIGLNDERLRVRDVANKLDSIVSFKFCGRHSVCSHLNFAPRDTGTLPNPRQPPHMPACSSSTIWTTIPIS